MPYLRGSRYVLMGEDAIKYLLRDEFTTATPPGLVNGTYPLVGGARVATDTLGTGGLPQCGITNKFANIVFDGNSLTAGHGIASAVDRYPSKVMAALNAAGIFADWLNNGMSGSSTPQMNQRSIRGAWQANTVYAKYVYVCPGNGWAYMSDVDGGTSGNSEPTWPTTLNSTVVDNDITWQCTWLHNVTDARYNMVVFGDNNIVVAWEIRNHLSGGATDTEAQAAFQAYCEARQTAGYKVVVLTALPGSDLTGDEETYRVSCNTWLRANYATFADALVDVANVTVCPHLQDCTNETYYQADHLHITAAGAAEIATAVTNILQPMITETTLKGLFLVNTGTLTGWGDPGFWESAINRTAGRMTLLTIIHPSNYPMGQIIIGLHSAQSSYPNIHSMGFYKNNISVTGIGTIGTYAFDTLYYILIDQRNTGVFYYIKGGIYTNWTPIFIRNSGTTATLYPAVTMNYCVTNVQYIRIPSSAYLAAPKLSDGFGGTRTGLGQSDGLGHLETSGLGSGGNGITWVQGGNAVWSVGGGYAACTPTLGATLNSGTLTIGQYYKIIATEADHFYSGCAANKYFRATAATALDANNTVKQVPFADISAGYDFGTSNIYIYTRPLGLDVNTQGGARLCMDSLTNPQSFVDVYYNRADGKYHIDQCLAGTWTELITPVASSASYSMDISKSGNKICLTLDQANWASIGIATIDDSIKNNTKHGMMTTYPGGNFDYFVGWDGGSAALDTVFDKYK